MKKTRLGKSDAVQENKEVFANGNGFDGDIVISEKAQKVLTDKTRQLTGKALLALNIICFSMTLFQLYAAGPGNLSCPSLYLLVYYYPMFFASTFCRKLQVINAECCTMHFP
jgi:hypothetical protein